MFALIAGPAGPGDEGLDRLAARLAPGEARLWREEEGRGAAVAARPDLLPEDVNDAQPILADGTAFVCRVRLDDRDGLARTLGLDPSRAAAMGDSALLFAAYRRWERDCPNHVHGDFVYAAWHWREGRLEAAVDHWGGSAALFWAPLGRGLIVADNLSLLVAHPDVPRTPDLDALAGFMRAGIDRSSTPYRAVRMLSGGHRLEYRGGDARVRRWWRPDTEPDWSGDCGERAERTRHLLDQAVKARLRSSGKVASTLSGGLDSGLVAALAAKRLARSGAGLLAYTAIPEAGLSSGDRPGWDLDDRPWAAATAARHPNIAHICVSAGGRSPIDVLGPMAEGSATPVRGGANLLWLDLISSSARAAGARVLLTGQQGNFSLSHSGEGALPELLARGRWSEARAFLAETAGSRPRAAMQLLARPALRRLLYTFGSGRLQAPAASFLREGRAAQAPGPLDAPPGSRRQWLAFAALPPHGWRCDPVERWDLDWRDPTADRRLIEAVLTFPLAAFRAGGRPRGLARQVAEGLLPDEVRLRTNRGEQSPDRAGLIARDCGRYRSAAALLAGSPLVRELIDTDRFGQVLRGIIAGEPEARIQAGPWLQALTLGLFLAGEERR